jgi:streptogramin lyase
MRNVGRLIRLGCTISLLAFFLVACFSTSNSETTMIIMKASPASLYENQIITLRAIIKIPISKIEFFQGSTKLGENTLAPYELKIPAKILGNTENQSFSARAITKDNQNITTQTVEVKVLRDTQAPNVTLDSNVTTITKIQGITITATASDNKVMSKVEFYEGITKIGEDAIAPYTLELNYSKSENGIHSYTAKAYDVSNYIKDSNVVNINVEIFTITEYPLEWSPNDLTFDASGNLWFVQSKLDLTSGVKDTKISMINSNDLASCTPENCRYTNYPVSSEGIAFDPSGYLWFVLGIEDSTSGIGKFTASDLTSCVASSCAHTDYRMQRYPKDPTFDTNGNLWFALQSGWISKITANDLVSCPSTDCIRTDYPVQGNPEAIAFDNNGNLWFASPIGQRLSKISKDDLAACTPLNCHQTDYILPYGFSDIAFDSLHNLWFLTENQIGKISATELASCIPPNCHFTYYDYIHFDYAASSGHIVFDNSGNLWFTVGSNKISKATL